MGRCSSEAEQRFRKPQAKGSTPFTGSTFYALPGNGLYLMLPGRPAPITTVIPITIIPGPVIPVSPTVIPA